VDLRCVLRWGPGDFERPWRVVNPSEINYLAGLLATLGQDRRLVVALEPTGTYGDPLRQALARANVPVFRVSPKMAKDYAEIFDGVPSQHDGKDAAVVAELAALGRCWPWAWQPLSAAEQEMVACVDWLDGQRRQSMMWLGRIEALLSRHWPEATRLVALTSATLLRCVAKYGGPAGLAADPAGLSNLRRWGRFGLSAAKAEALWQSARATVGVEQGHWDCEQLRRSAEIVLACRKEMRQHRRRLQSLAAAEPVLAAQGQVVGAATACVLWVHLGDPRNYHCGGAYRKAMGLNLVERSSGQYEGKLKLSKRGPSAVRRWLYLAALRWVRREPVRGWYLQQKARRRGEGKPAVVGVMRKLASALYQVGGRGESFVAERLYEALTTS
jgi:transposase